MIGLKCDPEILAEKRIITKIPRRSDASQFLL
jgi:hypothetical protein